MTKLTKVQKHQLWKLFLSADLNRGRIVAAENELTSEGLTLWLEDGKQPFQSIDECVELLIPTADLAAFIEANKLNSYEGMKPGRHSYIKGMIEIAPAIEWFENDATDYQRRDTIEMIVSEIINSLKSAEVAA